jgi:hypothetical protein
MCLYGRAEDMRIGGDHLSWIGANIGPLHYARF